MSIVMCQRCDKRVDTDYEEMETVKVGPEDTEEWCQACAEKHEAEIEADMKAAYEEWISSRNEQAERQEIKDAGRGHLLAEYWGL